MEYLFAALIVFSSLFLGRVIAKYTKEEISAGKKYFDVIEKTLLILCISLFFGVSIYFLLSFSSWIKVVFVILGLLSGVLFGLLGRKIPLFRNPFLYLGIGLAFSAFSSDFFLTVSSIIFLYGLAYSRNDIHMKKFFLFFLLLMIPVATVSFINLFGNALFFFAFSFGGLLVLFLQTFFKEKTK